MHAIITKPPRPQTPCTFKMVSTIPFNCPTFRGTVPILNNFGPKSILATKSISLLWPPSIVHACIPIVLLLKPGVLHNYNTGYIDISSSLYLFLPLYYQKPKELVIFKTVDSGNELTTDMIIQRIINHRYTKKRKLQY